MIRLVIGSLDKGTGNGLFTTARSAGLSVEATEERYTREFLHGKGGPKDPLFGKPVYVVRIDGEREAVASVLDHETAAAVLAGRQAGIIEGGRSWWAT